MDKSWSHLPNARHIDWVLGSSKDRPELWATAWAASRAVCEATPVISWPLEESQYPVWNAIWDASTGNVVARLSLAALVAYDDCKQYLAMTYEELKVYAILSERPQAVLLLPMKWVQEYEREFLVTTA